MTINNRTVIVALFVAGLSALIAAVWYGINWNQDRPIVRIVNETIAREELDLSFTYPSGEQGYSLVEVPVQAATTSGALKGAFILMYTPDYIDYLARADEAGETPPSVSIFVYDAPAAAEGDQRSRAERLLDWARENRTLTNIPEGPVSEVELDGVDTFTYTADGLYQKRVYLAAYSGNYYFFVGQFDAPDDRYDTAFREIIESISFL